MTNAQRSSSNLAGSFADLVRSERYRELGELASAELGSGRSPLDTWALSFIIESTSRLDAESQLIQHQLAEAELRARNLETDRSHLLTFLHRLTADLGGDDPGAMGIGVLEDPDQSSRDVAQLTVRSFGTLRVSVDGESVLGWNGNKSQLVLSVLLAQPHRRASKDVLMETLWPDAAPTTSRRRLHQAVYTLRRAFAGIRPDIEFVLFERNHYLLNPELSIHDDVTEFEHQVAACRSGALATGDGPRALAHRLLSLYEAEFLDDVPYEDWVIRRRERLRLAFFGTAEQLADSLIAVDATDDAIVLMQRVLELDPTVEAAHRQLMRAHHRAGRHHFVRSQYNTCVAALEAELGHGPSPATRELYERLRHGSRAAIRS